MASSKQALLLATAVATVACLASLASGATQWVVGDECGWKKDINPGWANGKTFMVGDTLLFKYEEEKHSVAQVASENDFNTCNKDGNKIGQWCSGNDIVQLTSPGRAWFICTKGDHCSKGMKLAIDVVDPNSIGVPPPPPFGWPFPGMAPPPPPVWPYPGWAAPPPPSVVVWPSPVAVPPSAAVRNSVGGAVAVAAAAVVAAAAALMF